MSLKAAFAACPRPRPHSARATHFVGAGHARPALMDMGICSRRAEGEALPLFDDHGLEEVVFDLSCQLDDIDTIHTLRREKVLVNKLKR